MGGKHLPSTVEAKTAAGCISKWQNQPYIIVPQLLIMIPTTCSRIRLSGSTVLSLEDSRIFARRQSENFPLVSEPTTKERPTHALCSVYILKLYFSD